MKLGYVATVALTGLLMSTGAATAASIVLDFSGDSVFSTNSAATGASVSVMLEFTDASGGVNTLVTATNTTGSIPAFGDGATESTFTAFGLDFAPGVTGVSLVNPPAPGSAIDTLLLDESVGGISNGAPAAGSFSFALADNNNFEGGNANGGLKAGDTQTATVFLTTALSASELMTAYQLALFDPSSGVNAVARFQQVNAGAGSDKLLFVPNDTPTPIPLPAAAWMLLAGVGGLATFARRKKA